jgi:hypothetical protein
MMERVRERSPQANKTICKEEEDESRGVSRFRHSLSFYSSLSLSLSLFRGFFVMGVHLFCPKCVMRCRHNLGYCGHGNSVMAVLKFKADRREKLIDQKRERERERE